MGAPLDWVLTYEAARSGAYGDSSQGVLDRIASSEKDNPRFSDLLSNGTIRPQESSRSVSNESGTGETFAADGNSIDWSRLPKMGPDGYTPPKGTMWESVSVDGSAGNIGTGGDFGYYDDPNYGRLGLVRQRAPDDLVMKLGRGLAIGMAAGPIGAALGGAAAASIGASQGLSASAISTLQTGLSFGVRTALSSAVSGTAPNPFSAVIGLLRPGIVLNSDFVNFIKGP